MDDRLDPRTLARLARIDPQLLSPVRHRSAEAQAHLTVIRARAALVGARSALVNTARRLAARENGGYQYPLSRRGMRKEQLAESTRGRLTYS
jgi:transposase